MKLIDLHKRSIEHGIAADPRNKAQLQRFLQKEIDKQKGLKGFAKECADATLQWNPYHDSRVLYDNAKDVRHLAVGIDIEVPELVLLDRLREKGHKIDACLIHHPEGRSLAELDKVMDLEIDLLADLGVPVNVTESCLGGHQQKIYRSIHAQNLFRIERTAELLDIPIFNCHTPTDNLAWKFIETKISSKSYDTLGEVVDALHKIEEYAYYAKKGNPCFVALGSPNGRTGKIAATEFTGGTNGPEEYVEAQARAGIGTIISMHATEKSIEAAKKHHINYIQCSHMASDTLGVNLMLDKLCKDEPKLEILELSGFIRVTRK